MNIHEYNLYNAIYRGDFEETKNITKYLYKSKHWRPGTDHFCTALVYRHVEIARLFLKQGCNVIDRRKKQGGYTPLHLAVLYGDSAMVREILRKGASMRLRNIEGMTPLHLIAYRNHDGFGGFPPLGFFDVESSIMLNIFHHYGSNINTDVNFNLKCGFTVLHLAVECGNENLIPLLLEKHADINRKTRRGFTPLHIATINGRSGIVRLLLNRGAVAFAKDAKGKSPLRWALEKCDQTIAEIFINYEYPSRNYYLPKLTDDSLVLLSAINWGHVSFVEALLNKGVPVSTYWRNRETALHVAVNTGNEEIVNLVLNYGASLQTVTKDGKTPLYLAVEKGVARIVEIIMNKISENDFTILLTGPPGLTPLHVAVMSDKCEIVRLLLLKGSRVYRDLLSNMSCNISAESLLFIAAKNGNPSICKLLIDNGADIDKKDTKGRNAIYFAADAGNLELVNDLSEISLKRSPNPKKWTEGYTALYISALNGNDAIVELLLKKGVDLKANIKGYSTPLHVAAEQGHEKIVKLLLNNGFDANEPSKDVTDGRTALHYGIQKKSVAIVNCLLEKGADVHSKIKEGHKSGYTPLLCAAEAGDAKIVDLLLKKGADVNARTKYNETPLLVSVLFGYEDVVQSLVNYGADLNITVKMKEPLICEIFCRLCTSNESPIIRPLTLALAIRNNKIIDILLKNGSPADMPNDQYPPLHYAAAYQTVENVDKLLLHGANLNSICSRGYTPVAHAIQKGNIKTFRYLIKNKGVKLNTRTETGDSLLHVAVKSNNTDKLMMMILLNLGLDIKARNNNLKTALHCYSPLHDMVFKTKMYEVLLDYGAEVNAVDYEGNTPLHVAVENRNIDNISLFLQFGADINVVNLSEKTAFEALYGLPSEELGFLNIANLFTQEIVRREFAKLYVHQNNLELINKKEKIKVYYEKCKKELSQMIDKEICDRFSVGDILIRNVSKLDTYFRNKSLIYVLDNIEYEKIFPIYGEILKSRIRKATERKHLLESSDKRLKKLFDFEFPSLVVENIFNYLSSADLKNVKRAFEPSSLFLN